MDISMILIILMTSNWCLERRKSNEGYISSVWDRCRQRVFCLASAVLKCHRQHHFLSSEHAVELFIQGPLLVLIHKFHSYTALDGLSLQQQSLKWKSLEEQTEIKLFSLKLTTTSLFSFPFKKDFFPCFYGIHFDSDVQHMDFFQPPKASRMNASFPMP